MTLDADQYTGVSKAEYCRQKNKLRNNDKLKCDTLAKRKKKPK